LGSRHRGTRRHCITWERAVPRLERTVLVAPSRPSVDRDAADQNWANASARSSSALGRSGLGRLTTSMSRPAPTNWRTASANSVAPIICPWVFCAETEKEAFECAKVHFREMMTGSYHNYQFGLDRTNRKGYEAYKPVELEPFHKGTEFWLDHHIVGTPDQCVERVMALSHMFGAEEFVGEFKYGNMTREQGERSMRLFADEVLPKLHEATPGDPMSAKVAERAAV